MKRYKKGKGAWFTNEQAQVYGQRLDELSGSGNITAEIIVEDAKRVSSPLHKVFEWDDTTEAHRWRLHKARLLLSNIEIEIVTSKTESRWIQANVSLVGQKGYTSIVKVLSDNDLKEQWIQQALKEAESWMNRYQNYKELADIFTVIKKTKKKLFKK